MIRAEDELLHRGSKNPHWNESANFSFAVPEERVNGFVHFYHRPNQGYSVGGPALWDPTGEDAFDCIHYDFGVVHPTPDGAEMFDFTLPSGLTVECVEPLSRYRLTYAGDGCGLDLNWEQLSEPHEDTFPGETDEWGSFHYEQVGRMRGTVHAAGRQLAIDSLSLRDHSWGPRTPELNVPRGDVAWAFASERDGFMAIAVRAGGRDDDEVIGTTEILVPGFGVVVRDGETGTVASGTRRVVGRGEQGRPLRVVIDVTDDLGRELHAEGECVNWFRSPAYPYLFQWWCLAQWKFDGLTAWGEEQDYWAAPHARRFLRSLRKA